MQQRRYMYTKTRQPLPDDSDNTNVFTTTTFQIQMNRDQMKWFGIFRKHVVLSLSVWIGSGFDFIFS